MARAGIVSMREALSRMPVGCHPLIFYQRVRPFLSGWKANPTLPDGVLYEVLKGITVYNVAVCVKGLRGNVLGEFAGRPGGGGW